MKTTTTSCDVCKRQLPVASKNRDDQVYTFILATDIGRPITGPQHPDICRKCLSKGFTVSMDACADVHFKIIDDTDDS